MSNLILEEKIINFEKQMWEAFATGNSESFGDLVSKDALMICGGFRETGSEYTAIVSQIRLQGYELTDIIVKEVDLNSVLINYIVTVKSSEQDLNGKYRVSSLWVKNDEKWKVVFNQDSKIGF
ncbi:nuclear transport factor 2 family protein [Acetivibrio mesophilus]|uniref:Nuclear transport factor 2 family protein n=1 Tax=Acetivibrio mesophilus TaxID=2487273 RepID=A0A4Q0I120_9FIRM|nr:nuclear transport factor 2 family protein [Acetivibrio mesophilus]RXE57916.1 nuclear transport factor 2 family protein [Acetivibrio mesophilus]